MERKAPGLSASIRCSLPGPRGKQRLELCPLSPTGQHVLLGLRFQELSWDHTSPEEEEPVLWLEFDGDSEGTPINKLLRIYSKQVMMWSHTLRQRGWAQVSSGSQTTGGSPVPRRRGWNAAMAWREHHPGSSDLLWDPTSVGGSCKLDSCPSRAYCLQPGHSCCGSP